MPSCHRFIGAMVNQRSHPPLLAVIAAIAFLAVETIALAHEIEHDLEQHDEPSCALHLYASHFAKSVGGDFSIALAPALDTLDVAPASAAPLAALFLGYRGRAPPQHVATVN